ncbi:DUF7536 family protein [Halorhabdus amylolytica]|uniref:DUF7536 family protein n=1 Tax=Halorhabdus amylolytica TaxID=2559573 RepID=UPI0010AA2B80|nr:hypothetical protein [Halorhabdus amylolytica]
MSGQSDGKARLLEALDVRGHLRRGIAVGVALAVATYLLFVAGSSSLGTQALYLSLTVVLALTTTAVVTTILVGAEAYKLLSEDGSVDT